MTPSTNPKLIDDGRFFIVTNEAAAAAPVRLVGGSLYVRHSFEKEDSKTYLLGTYRYVSDRQWNVTALPTSPDDSPMSMGEYGSKLGAITALWQFRKTFDLSSLFT